MVFGTKLGCSQPIFVWRRAEFGIEVARKSDRKSGFEDNFQSARYRSPLTPFREQYSIFGAP
jgi:hypothetical protein